MVLGLLLFVEDRETDQVVGVEVAEDVHERYYYAFDEHYSQRGKLIR